jgi:hypothetical protein
LQVRLSAPSTVTPGTYALTWSSTNSSGDGGVTSLSRPSTGSATLTVLAAAPPAAEPEPPVSGTTTSAPPEGRRTSSAVPVLAPQPGAPVRALAPATQTLAIPLILPPPAGVIVEPPSALSLERAPRRVGEMEPAVPEPLGAGAWLGLGTGLLASGGILATLRRRFARSGRARVETLERID